MFHEILKTIQDFDTIIIHRHGRPDGDAIGSQVGMQQLLLENFPGKHIYMVGDNPGFYGFIEGSKMDEIPDSTYNGALAIILDSGSRSMINDDRYQLAAKTVRFDHHIFSEKIADLEIIDTGFESCCGLITEFAVQCGLKLNLAASKALFTGMITDSGRFRYDSTNSRTFRLASKLMEQDIDTNELYRTLYADDFSSKLLKAKFILKIRFTENNVAYIYTTRQELEELNADTFTVSRGMVGTMSDTKGVDIWVNFTETDKGVLCELRSSKYNINPIAVKYGGGGHAKASGATVADKQTAMAMLADLDAMIGENK
ncbi:MAG: bifunctional oligoribonuclease/PAP phosphatase NrnA [Oscillospiraceae bacterium]|nr:bifunctional oligoribonuclease/PAP phosphatase NrnA [Oscillospiraceae bacterium]